MMNYYNDNYRIAVTSLTEARDDHYDKENAIYRLSACVKISNSTTFSQVYTLLYDLSKLEVRPRRLFLNENMLEVDWAPRGFQMVMNRGQYAGLVLEFAEFLNKTGIPDLVIQEGFFWDDPGESVKGVSADLINFFPTFNADCFGAKDNEPIEIMDCINHLTFSCLQTKKGFCYTFN